jgi:hypothetical protein
MIGLSVLHHRIHINVCSRQEMCVLEIKQVTDKNFKNFGICKQTYTTHIQVFYVTIFGFVNKP